jgi:hypothetical protein
LLSAQEKANTTIIQQRDPQNHHGVKTTSMGIIRIMDRNHQDNKNDQQKEHQLNGRKEQQSVDKKKMNHNHNNNDTILASKIDVLLQQEEEHQDNNDDESNNSRIRAVYYANECHVIALILLSRIQDFNRYLACWQKHHEQLLSFLQRRLVAQQQQQEQQEQQEHQEEVAAVDDSNDNNKDIEDDNTTTEDYYCLELQAHWIRLVALLLSRFDDQEVVVVAKDDDALLLRMSLLSSSSPSSNSIVRIVVDALTEILVSFLLQTNETTISPHRYPDLPQQARVEAIKSLACALDIVLSSSPQHDAMLFDNADRILSSIWGYYHDAVISVRNDSNNFDTTAKVQVQVRPFIPIQEKQHYDVMLQTLTALWNNDNYEDDKNVVDGEPIETTMTSGTDAANAAVPAAAARILDACWYILSVYGSRMASFSSSSSSSPTTTTTTATATTTNTGLPTFWQLALDWWCRCSKNQHHQATTTHMHYLAWAELLLQMIQSPGTHDSLQFLLRLPADDDDFLNGGEGGEDDNDIDSSSSSNNSCSTAQNLFQLLLACIVSPEQQAVVHRPLGSADIIVLDDSHNANQQQANNRVLRPLAWTCLTNLLQSEKIGWDWLLLMEGTTKKSSSSSGSSSSNRGRHLTTLVRLAVGEWKIQLGYYLVAGENTEHDKNSSNQQQERQEDCETLILVCGQSIVQTVQFIAQLADDVMDHDNDDAKRKAVPMLSATSINHLRRSLDEALDAAVQYLGLHPEQHGRVPQIDACAIRVLGSLLTEMNVFDQHQHRRPQSQQQGEGDSDENDNATLHALRIAMELTTKSNNTTSKASSGGGERISTGKHEGYHALMPSLAYVLASAEGDEHCVQLLKDYNVLDKEILPPFLHSFWDYQRQENLEAFASIVPWCCQVIELYVGQVTVAETEGLQSDLIAWIRRVLRQLPLSSATPVSEQQQVLVKSLESAVSCYVTLQGETQPPEPDFSIIQRALETCARCLSSEKEK